MNFYRKIFFIAMTTISSVLFCPTQQAHGNANISIDSRVKYLAYNANEVFNIVVGYGYQSYIEFSEGEFVQNMAIGSKALWNVQSIGNKIFMTPLSKNSHTNMIILTNKNRSYAFDLNSLENMPTLNEDISYEREMSYIIRFFYPDSDLEYNEDDSIFNFKTARKDESQYQNLDKIIKKNSSEQNYNYISDKHSKELVPLEIFDDGSLTYMKFNKTISGIVGAIPRAFLVTESAETPLKMLSFNGYIVIKGIHKKLSLRFKEKRVEIINVTF